MHELSICHNILEIIKKIAVSKAYTQVKIIYLEIGELVAIEKSALLFSFEVIATGTVAENAMLKFIDIPGQGWCEMCKKTINIKKYGQSCGFCGSYALSIINGEELRIKSMEVS